MFTQGKEYKKSSCKGRRQVQELREIQELQCGLLYTVFFVKKINQSIRPILVHCTVVCTVLLPKLNIEKGGPKNTVFPLTKL